jgi:hypothetical protein
VLRIDNTIFSLDILEKKFVCDLRKCLGNCCRYGDAGAPLTSEEALKLDSIWPSVKPLLRPEGVATIEKMGTSVRDIDGELVTPLIDEKECAYTIRDGGIYTCGIEKAWAEGKVDYQKPLSCHLYPVRIKQFSDFQAVNYDQQDVCSTARVKGRREGVFVYEFLKSPLIRALGKEMYDELCLAARELRKQKNL